MKELSSEEFDEIVLLLPSAVVAAERFTSNKITELPSESSNKNDDFYQLVFLHAEWASKSRELQLQLAKLSTLISSPTLQFYVISTENAPSSFYDLEISIQPSSVELPVLLLYHQGRVVGRLPGNGKSPENEEDEDSDDERETEQRKGRARINWDRSTAALVKAFELEKLSGKQWKQ